MPPYSVLSVVDSVLEKFSGLPVDKAVISELPGTIEDVFDYIYKRFNQNPNYMKVDYDSNGDPRIVYEAPGVGESLNTTFGI